MGLGAGLDGGFVVGGLGGDVVGGALDGGADVGFGAGPDETCRRIVAPWLARPDGEMPKKVPRGRLLDTWTKRVEKPASTSACRH